MKTTYELVYPEIKGIKKPEPFKSLSAVHKFLLENKAAIKKATSWGFISITCAWVETDPKQPKGFFNPHKLGFREFSLEKNDTMSYSRFPMYEY